MFMILMEVQYLLWFLLLEGVNIVFGHSSSFKFRIFINNFIQCVQRDEGFDLFSPLPDRPILSIILIYVLILWLVFVSEFFTLT